MIVLLNDRTIIIREVDTRLMVNEPDNMLVNAYRRVSYICSKCKTKRDVIVDQMMHLSRAELKQNGLAPYIDIHENLKTSSQDEHGMRIFVDTHFHVRSNDPMVRDEPIHEITAKLPGLPMPKMAINNKKILYNSISWNSLELTSESHNMGFFLINPDPSLTETDNKVISINSPLNTIGVKINYQESRLSKEYLENCNEWLSHLIKWIELTASLNIYIIPSLLFYIDIQHVRPPSVSDELIISILIDASAQIHARSPDINVNQIMDDSTNFPYHTWAKSRSIFNYYPISKNQ
jgi:hypothetical protein